MRVKGAFVTPEPSLFFTGKTKPKGNEKSIAPEDNHADLDYTNRSEGH